MNKKVLVGIIAALIVAGAGIYAINSNSNNTSSEIAETSNNTEEKNTNDNNSDSNSEKTQTSNPSSENSTPSDNTVTNDENATTLDELDAAANAEIASDKDSAIKKLVDYYLGVNNTFTKNTTKVTLTTNADNTVTISKTTEDSNVYYTGKDELSETVSDALILTIESYNEAERVYTYSIKSYSDVKSGNTSKNVDSGSIPEKGAVTSDLKSK